MSALALFLNLLPFATLSLFQYTQKECDHMKIVGVYASSTQTDTLLIKVSNDKTNNVFPSRECMPNPTWKGYDTRLSNNVKFYGASTTTTQCVTDQTYEVPKATQSDSTAAEGDRVSLTLELWVNDNSNPTELACKYKWTGLLVPENICDNVRFNNIYLKDGVHPADTIMMDVSAPWNQFACSYFGYPTFKIYGNNNELWGNMDKSAQGFCLVPGEYPINMDAARSNELRSKAANNEQVSITIEVWHNWNDFLCSWDWNGIIPYVGSNRRLLSNVEEKDAEILVSGEGNADIMYHFGAVFSLLLLLNL